MWVVPVTLPLHRPVSHSQFHSALGLPAQLKPASPCWHASAPCDRLMKPRTPSIPLWFQDQRLVHLPAHRPDGRPGVAAVVCELSHPKHGGLPAQAGARPSTCRVLGLEACCLSGGWPLNRRAVNLTLVPVCVSLPALSACRAPSTSAWPPTSTRRRSWRCCSRCVLGVAVRAVCCRAAACAQ